MRALPPTPPPACGRSSASDGVPVMSTSTSGAAFPGSDDAGSVPEVGKDESSGEACSVSADSAGAAAGKSHVRCWTFAAHATHTCARAPHSRNNNMRPRVLLARPRATICGPRHSELRWLWSLVENGILSDSLSHPRPLRACLPRAHGQRTHRTSGTAAGIGCRLGVRACCACRCCAGGVGVCACPCMSWQSVHTAMASSVRRAHLHAWHG